MSVEDTRMLLKFREDLEKSIERLQVEIRDIRKAIAEIDKLIVQDGFRQPRLRKDGDREDEIEASIKAKDGTVLGSLQVYNKRIVFLPRKDLDLSVSTPPFQSFLIDRVLANMRSSDEIRAARGEINFQDIFNYEVLSEGEELQKLIIRNYGGERQLSEIKSGLRWTLDKMYQKPKTEDKVT
jgi:hypothetical protein